MRTRDGHGVIDGHDWMAKVRLSGNNRAAAWDELDSAKRSCAETVLPRVNQLIDNGRRATSRVPSVLVHTDAVLANVVWTGSAEIPHRL